MQLDDRVNITGGQYMGQTGAIISTEITSVGQAGHAGTDALGWWMIELDEGGTVMLPDDIFEVIPAE